MKYKIKPVIEVEVLDCDQELWDINGSLGVFPKETLNAFYESAY